MAKFYIPGNQLYFNNLTFNAGGSGGFYTSKSSTLITWNNTQYGSALGGQLALNVPADVEFFIRVYWGSAYMINLAHRLSSMKLATDASLFDSGYGLHLGVSSTEASIYRASTRLAYYNVGNGTARGRFRLNGTSLQAKVWLEPNDEPSSWQMSVTDSTYTSGVAGLATRAGTIYAIGIGTDGSEAPQSGSLRTISGQVTLAGSPVSGAKVFALLHPYSMESMLISGVHYAEATTDNNGNYTLTLNTDHPGPWLISARAIINGVYYTSAARLAYFS